MANLTPSELQQFLQTVRNLRELLGDTKNFLSQPLPDIPPYRELVNPEKLNELITEFVDLEFKIANTATDLGVKVLSLKDMISLCQATMMKAVRGKDFDLMPTIEELKAAKDMCHDYKMLAREKYEFLHNGVVTLKTFQYKGNSLQ